MKARDLAACKWPSILARLGVPADALDGHHHACPKDGGGKDRFRFADRNGSGSYFCACSEGDKGGMALLMCCRGWDYFTAAKEVEAIAGGFIASVPRERKDPAIALNRIRTLLQHAGPDVESYLAGRGLETAPGLRQARLGYWKDGAKVGDFAAMVARVDSPEGKPLTYHVTYLKDGKKAPIDPARKILTPTHPTPGGAIRLYPAADELGIAEGIETAIAAKQTFGLPVWSCMSDNGVATFDPPVGVQKLWVFGDNDPSYAGQAAAYACAKRMAKRGIECAVVLPPRYGDWNDALQEKGAVA